MAVAFTVEEELCTRRIPVVSYAARTWANR
jgi:hypothetical protein